ncbi:MAG: hypothetical protein ACOYBT_09815 [Polynucleobacter sp.]
MTDTEQADRAREVLADVLGYRLENAQRVEFMAGNFIPILFPDDAIRAMLTFATEAVEAERQANAAMLEQARGYIGAHPGSTLHTLLTELAARIRNRKGG